MCPHTTMGPHATMCPHATCVLILLDGMYAQELYSWAIMSEDLSGAFSVRPLSSLKTSLESIDLSRVFRPFSLDLSGLLSVRPLSSLSSFIRLATDIPGTKISNLRY